MEQIKILKDISLDNLEENINKFLKIHKYIIDIKIKIIPEYYCSLSKETISTQYISLIRYTTEAK